MSAVKFVRPNTDPLERRAAASVRQRIRNIRDNDAISLLNNNDDDDYSDIHDIWEDPESNEKR